MAAVTHLCLGLLWGCSRTWQRPLLQSLPTRPCGWTRCGQSFHTRHAVTWTSGMDWQFSSWGGGHERGGPSNLGRWFGGARTPKSRDLGVEMGGEAWQHGVRHWDAWLPWKPEEDVGLRWDMGQKRGQWGQKGSAWGSIKIGRWFGGARTPKSRDLGVEMGGEA